MSASIPRTSRLEYARAVDAGASVLAEAWSDEPGWSFVSAMRAGRRYLRARLEATAPVATLTGRESGTRAAKVYNQQMLVISGIRNPWTTPASGTETRAA